MVQNNKACLSLSNGKSSNKVGWFCKTCKEYSDTGDQYWKTLPRKHYQHPSISQPPPPQRKQQQQQQQQQQNKQRIKQTKKQEVKQILKKGRIRQILKGAENKTAKEKQNNRIVLKIYIS